MIIDTCKRLKMRNVLELGKDFYVVRLLELPYEGVEECVCVPYSWIKSRKSTHRKVLVAYPAEEPIVTKERVERKQKPSRQWGLFKAIVKYCTDVYYEAEFWIASRDTLTTTQNDNSHAKGNQQLRILDRKRRRVNWANSTIANTKRRRKAIALSNYRRKTVRGIPLKRSAPPLSESDTQAAHTKEDEMAEPNNKTSNYLSLEAECKKRKLIVVTENILVQNFETKGVSSASSHDVNVVQQNIRDREFQSQGTDPSVPTICVEDSDEENSKIQISSENATDNRTSVIQSLSNCPGVRDSLPRPSSKVQSQLVPLGKPLQRTCVQEIGLCKTNNQSSGPYSDSDEPSYLRSQINTLESQRTKEAFLNKSEEVSSNYQIAESQNISNNAYATQSLSHPVKWSSRLAELLCSSPPKSLQRDSQENVKKKVSTVVQTISDLTIEKSYRQSQVPTTNSVSPIFQNSTLNMPQTPLPQNIVRPVEANSLNERARILDVTNNEFSAQRLSETANQPRQYAKQLHNRQYTSTQLSYSQHYPHLQNIVQVSDGRKNIDQRTHPPHVMTNGTYYVQASLNSENQTGQIVRHTMNLGYTQIDPRKVGNDVRNIANIADNGFINNPSNLLINAPPPGVNCSDTSNQFNGQFQTSHENLQRFPYPQNLQIGMSVGAAGIKGTPIAAQSCSYNVYSTHPNSYTQEILRTRAAEPIYIHPKATPRHSTQLVRSDTQNEITQPTFSQITHYQPFNENNILHISRTQNPIVGATGMNCTPTDKSQNHNYHKSVAHQNSLANLSDRSCKTNERLMEESSSSAHKNTTGFQLTEKPQGTSYDGNRSQRIISTENDFENVPTDVRNSSLSANESLNSRSISEQKVLSDISSLFHKLSTDLLTTTRLFNNFHDKFSKLNETAQKMAESTRNNITQALSKGQSSSSSTSKGVEEVREEKRNSVDARDTSNRTYGSRPLFKLPPEYDPNDSKWTLRYRKCGPGLIELLPQSGIYVNADKLEKCKRLADDFKSLARMLLTEVFSRSALSVCSLTGTRAKAFKLGKDNVRPGLDEFARMVLFTFVERYGSTKGWGPFDSQSVTTSIRTKIYGMRFKYGK